MRNTLPLVALMASIGVGFAGISAAQTATPVPGDTGAQNVMYKMRGERPGVFGKVSAISGTTLTVSSTNPEDGSTTTYSVDAAGAKVMKGGEGTPPTESTLAAVAVGDMVAIRGTVSGTSVTATEIMDGPMMFRGRPGMGHAPGVRGTVTAVSGNTVTLSGADGKTYTIDASSASIEKMSTITVGQIAVGDTLGVQGTLSGTSVTAAHIMDGKPLHEQKNSDN